ncbi:MAG: hypothetical protein CVV44_20345 [Spirochaetae bacterium HGW-Spirochaetae-1]|jgi:hypothetical protein|nr:MAG: hypothetical protein CVV44_20345 [Spirochaetae bacterium HGW-Spirochaetae-1]
MLSENNTIPDIKKRLESFEYYGLDDDAEFDEQLALCVEDVMYERMVPVIGSVRYDEIAAMDKTDLSEYEDHIYRAEIFYSVAEFLRKQVQSERSKERRVSEERTGNQKAYVEKDFIDDAVRSLGRAGYNRTVSISRFGIAETWHYEDPDDY